jgi:RNA polymerase sigma-70 factor (ECF subfamily)
VRAGGAVIVPSNDLDTLYVRHRNEIIRYLKHTFGSGPPDPEDVIQVVFERYAALSDDANIGNPRAFLFRSARNFVVDERRRQIVRADHAREAQAIADSGDDLHAERVIDARQRLAAVEKAIGQLDADSRDMLLMNRLDGCSCAEIARLKQCSATLVKAKIARALVACHRALEGRG